MKVSHFRKTDEQIVVTFDDDSVQYIYIHELRGWAKKESRLTTQRQIFCEGIHVDSDTIPISFDDYLRTLDKTEIEVFLIDRSHGVD